MRLFLLADHELQILYNLENACKIQVDVMASGAEQIIPNQNAIASVEQFSLIGKAGADDPDSYLRDLPLWNSTP